ncbi:CPBP family intramembrane glutamic endopeptidase [Leucobacter triazinivorans]|uniref:CPBP family intramembrane metalloprotease n=1 Tax=Leucobacter triazinivorans TaxID=1784719 RepID=A0A4V0Z1Q4_9MICO|nr:CPBP family intramembrane glutamic endopeptidase [Leucobacter triazinivorans]QBE49219.1 CPBP family intramembrane metalloprotease [Leucobacter triazinivorans]
MNVSSSNPTSAWRRFWNRGGFWKALGFTVAYWVIYQLIGGGTGAAFGGLMVEGDPLASPLNVLLGKALPILITGALALALAASLGWLRDLFGPQPISGPGWMWIAVVVVMGFNVLRFASVDYSAAGAGLVISILILGLCVGFTEELIARGFNVLLLRRGGYGEWSVMMLTALLFSLMHLGNFFAGLAPISLAVLAVYTFAFGIMMYLVLRVTRSLVWAMLAHAATDPSLMLLTGGIDTAGQLGDPGPLLQVANQANLVVILSAIVLLIFVRGKVGRAHFGVETGAP